MLMDLSLAVNASLVDLSKFSAYPAPCRRGPDRAHPPAAIFCTDLFCIPFAGRVDMRSFDKTGTITMESPDLRAWRA